MHFDDLVWLAEVGSVAAQHRRDHPERVALQSTQPPSSHQRLAPPETAAGPIDSVRVMKWRLNRTAMRGLALLL